MAVFTRLLVLFISQYNSVCFFQIARIDPEFQPTSMLDFGSGLATSVW